MGKSWFITGVSSGLGRELAKAALGRGDKVAGTVRKPADAEAFAELGASALPLAVDITDEAGLRAAVAQAEAAFGGIDVLVNNAGYGLIAAIEEASLTETRAQFEVNVFGALAAIQAVLPAMRARGAGHVINVTSVSGLAAWSGTGIYCASKFALEAIGETLAQEVGPLGIKVTNVAPGGMRTDYAGRSMTRAANLIAAYESTAHEAPRLLAGHAGHESGDPAKAAVAILKVADLDAPPLHLLLGADAIHYATRKIGQLTAEIGDWAAVSTGVAFED